MKPPSSTSSSMSLTRAVARGLVHAHQLERQSDVGLDRAPVEQHRRLEDHAVFAAESGVVGGLAVDLGHAGSRPDQVADDAQQRALAAAGRADERHELARLDRQVDVLESGHSAVLGLEDLADVCQSDCRRAAVVAVVAGRRSRHAAAPRPRRVSAAISTTRTTRKNMMPTSEATRIVAQSFSGPVMYCWLKVRIARPRPC